MSQATIPARFLAFSKAPQPIPLQPCVQPSNKPPRSSQLSRVGSASTLISTLFPPMTEYGFPSANTTTPADPFTSTGWLTSCKSASEDGVAPCTRLRARLASCRAAVEDRPTIGAISSNDTPNMSCSTNASRSAGSSASSHDRVGHVRDLRLLAPRLARAQHVQAHPRDDRRQPSPQVLDLARVRTAEPQPGFLYRVVHLAQRAEHPVGHRPQVGPILLEPPRQPVALVHRHILAPRFVMVMTNETGPV